MAFNISSATESACCSVSSLTTAGLLAISKTGLICAFWHCWNVS